MKEIAVIDTTELSGDELLRALAALANPHRLQIMGRLAGGRTFVSGLAREIGMSRPLLHMHLQRLEAAGLVAGTLELSEDGRAMKYFEVVPFAIALTPERIAALTWDGEKGDGTTADAPNAAQPRHGTPR